MAGEPAITLTCARCGGAREISRYDPSHRYRCTLDGCGGDLVDPAEAQTVRTDQPPEVSGAAADPRNRFGKYVLVRLLGRGGMGSVHKAWDTTLHRWVALKFLLLSDSPEDVRRFHREARTAASLKHPNIAAIYEVGEAEGKPFIAMEYVDGKSLSGLKLTAHRACEIVRDAAFALEYAHGQSIVHRDLKPGNILVAKDGKPVVLDFGLAKSLRDAAKLTASGTVVGTPAYMSPEQALGRARDVDARSDVYQLGAILYEILTGRPPFRGETAAEILKRVTEDEVVPPSRLASVPPDLETIVLRAMDKDRKRRFPSAEALAADLSRFLSGRAIVARRSSTFTRLARTLRRHKALAGAAAVAALALALGSAYQARQSASRRAEIEGHVREAERQFASGNYPGARDSFNRALALDPAEAGLLERIAECDRRLARARAEAEAQKERAERLARAKDEARPDYERGVSQLEESWKDLYRQGADLVRMRERLRSAIDAFTDALRKWPENPDAFLARGRARALRFDFEEADRDFARAVELLPGFEKARSERARLLFQRYIEAKMHLGWRWDDAVARPFLAWKEEARKLADDPAFLAFVEDRMTDCLRLCEARLKEKPEQEELWKLSGDALLLGSGTPYEGHPTPEADALLQKAIAAYGEAIRLRPNFYEARMFRGYAHAQRGDARRAEEDITLAHRLRPDDALACWLMGRTAPSQARALEWFEAGLKGKPDSLVCRMGRAAALGHLERFDEALKELEGSMGLNPAHSYPWYLRGALRSRTGKMEEAYEDFRKVTQMDPAFVSGWYNLGATAYNTGRFREAMTALERAIAAGHPERDRLEAILRAARRQLEQN